MKTIDKIRLYLKEISQSEEHYDWLLENSYVNPKYRNEECLHPEHATCQSCELNRFLRS